MATITRERSHEIFTRACQLMPGGVNSPARAFGAVGGEPIIMQSASGPYITDVDGNQYVDYIGSWGPMILGHSNLAVVEAVQKATEKGTSFGAPTAAENRLAELVIEAVPSIEKVRLVNSGTEATMSAIRVARGYTGRDLVIKFAGNYHGHVDSLLVSAGSAAATLAVPNSPGVTEGTSKDTIVLPYNDVDKLTAAFAEYAGKIACVILEPVVGNMGCVIPHKQFLTALRDLTTEHGSVLIFDEVMTGFRVAYGGAQSLYGVTPDMTTLGKIVGGGLPLGAYGGRAEIMDQVLPAGKVFQAGTLSGNPIATAAGTATLEQLKSDPPYDRLEKTCSRLAEGLSAAAKAAGLEHCVQRVGSMMTLFFHPGPVNSWDDAAKCDTTMFGKFFWGMMDRGIYLPCSQYEALFVSAQHGDDEITKTIASAHEVLAQIVA